MRHLVATTIIASVASPGRNVGAPLTDKELLHAVAVAPSEIPVARWIREVLPAEALVAVEAPEQIIALVVRCHDEVVAALAKHRTMTPAEDAEAACARFAAGYVAGAELDPA